LLSYVVSGLENVCLALKPEKYVTCSSEKHNQPVQIDPKAVSKKNLWRTVVKCSNDCENHKIIKS
jgi:hypothetical protein